MKCLKAMAMLGTIFTALPAYSAALVQGTMQAGGEISGTYEHSNVAASARGYVLTIAPGFGYFFIDDLEVRVGLGINARAGVIHADAPLSGSLELGLRYFFEFGWPVIPYAGVAVGTSLTFIDPNDSSASMAFAVPVGMVFPLNKNVALDVGLRGEYSAIVHNGATRDFTLRLGYFGVQAFF